ncbi:M-phase inducer phosphatase-like [Mytilus trossulus]|uniref:M-phase inducer phosphatase-like n=1 Tax=Mytilus trossulus TaxID=6551 RepID=UPI0030066A2F
MDLPCDSFFQKCDDMMAALFDDDDSGLGMDFDFRNDGTISPAKPTDKLQKRQRRFSPKSGTYSKQSHDLKAARSEVLAIEPIADGDMIGDGSRNCRLPTVFDSRHDLKCISADTLADVIRGSHNIGSYSIIDCRYPYEFQGGHITNADNMFKPEDLSRLFTSKSPSVLIFHCEFSIERGPAMCRNLRQKDRETNADNYPHLFYPEIYLLQDGYKSFYQTYPELCTPEGYLPMLDKGHASDLRHFRVKSKSWSVGQKSKPKKSVRLFD